MELWVALAIVVCTVLVLSLLTSPGLFGFGKRAAPEPEKLNLGGLTLEALTHYSGYDWSKPLVVAIKGKIYDVSSSFKTFGPGSPLHAYAGKEAARALAKGSTAAEDVGPGSLDDLTEEEATRLADEIAKYQQEYPVVGEVVPMLDLTLEELSRHNGADPAAPLYLSIQGVVYDIGKGKHFYGPDGIYPFAGREVARAFALMSTELTDCNDDLTGLSRTELENLRDWTAKFNSKYPIVGRLAQAKKDQ